MCLFKWKLLPTFDPPDTNWAGIPWICEILYFSEIPFHLCDKKRNAEEKKEVEEEWRSNSFSLVPSKIFFSDTQLMSNSHKCNPLCCIMFPFTFQECGSVRGVLIQWSMLFILTTFLSVSLCRPYLFSTLFTTLSQSNPLHPTFPHPLLTHFLCLKKKSWTI